MQTKKLMTAANRVVCLFLAKCHEWRMWRFWDRHRDASIFFPSISRPFQFGHVMGLWVLPVWLNVRCVVLGHCTHRFYGLEEVNWWREKRCLPLRDRVYMDADRATLPTARPCLIGLGLREERKTETRGLRLLIKKWHNENKRDVALLLLLSIIHFA